MPTDMSRLAGIGAEICFEQHDRKRWPWIADRAAEAGLAFSRMGEFIWDLVEPEEDRFDFTPVGEWVHLLAERGINAVLATPTASPPDWLCAQYPEIVPVKADGTSYGMDTRRHTCPTSPRYRERCERVVRAMARHLGGNASIVAWQIDNEIGHPFCYCPLCRRAFQDWIERRFRSIDEFNFRVGQAFWARSSRSFQEAPVPAANSNPCLHQVYGLFMDEQIRDCWGLQREWLRQEGVRAPITTNAMLLWYGYDHEKFFAPLDLVGGDAYPDQNGGGMYRDGDYPGIAFYSAFQRGIKHGQNFGMMETRCTPSAEGLPFPFPGEMTYWAFSFLAGGAQFVHFFRFDTSPSGGERGCGLLQTFGAPPPIFKELQALCARIKPLAPALVETTVPTAPVGIVYSHPTHLALQQRPMIEAFVAPYGNGYTCHLARHLRALASQNLPADVVHLGDDFRKYRVLIATGLVVVDAELAAKLARYVEEGGILLVGPWCGYLDEYAKQWEVPLPPNLDCLLGAERIVTEAFPPSVPAIDFIPEDATVLPRLKVDSVAEQFKVAPAAEVLAHFEGHPAGARLPALIRNRMGRGTTYVVGAFFDEDATALLYRALLKQHGIQSELTVPAGIHYAKRIGPGYELWFFLNSSRKPVEFDLPSSYEFENQTTRRKVVRLQLAPRTCDVLWRHG